MSVVGSQQQTFLRLLRALRPHWRRDPGLPGRIQSLFAQHKEFGSRDRRLYRELTYTALRYLPWIEPLIDTDPTRAARTVAWLAATTRATAQYRSESVGDWPQLPTVAERAAFLGFDATALLPSWFRDECPAAFAPDELDAQLRRAPLWLRIQTDEPESLAAEFTGHGWSWRASESVPSAWRLETEADVTKTVAFTAGRMEVQDLGSQMVLEAVSPQPGERWLDGCAGAGGKTLQLARLVGRTGAVQAFDVRPAALIELRSRVSRAGLANVRTGAPATGETYDGVLVDAPCSGSGTWRRSPHLKWTTSSETIASRARQQGTLLHHYAPHVRDGGLLVYATCSLARTENAGVISAFLAEHPEFSPAPFRRTFGFTPADEGMTIMPARHDTDGFFVACLQRKSATDR